jgi:hypothetical protein
MSHQYVSIYIYILDNVINFYNIHCPEASVSPHPYSYKMGTPYPIQNEYQLTYTKWAHKPIQVQNPTLMVPPEIPP